MTSEEEYKHGEELTEDALARRVYHLNMLYELNQEISTLRNMREVLDSSLLYIMGGFGLRSGLMAIYRGSEGHPCESVHRGLDAGIAAHWLRQMGAHAGKPYVREIHTTQTASDSPVSKLIRESPFSVWLPLEIDEQTWGGIALGAKLSETVFTADDLELLSTIAINIQNVLSNVSLIEALNQAFIKEKRIRNIFQRYAPGSVINEVLDPSNEELLLGESQVVRDMFEQMIARLEEQHALEQDLELAHSVQKYLLPTSSPRVTGIDIAARSIPARGLCGDFYDFIPLGQYEMGLSLGDISGKGISAAMIATMMQSATRMCVGNYYPIPAILSIINRFVFRHTETNRYATMFYGQVDAQEQTFTYSNAGHPPAMLCRDRKIHLLEIGGSLVGIFEDCSYDQETIELRPNDLLVVYSDGVTDAGTTPESISFEEDAFGQERLEGAILANASLPAKTFLDAVCGEVTRYAGNSKQFDDITLIVMKVS